MIINDDNYCELSLLLNLMIQWDWILRNLGKKEFLSTGNNFQYVVNRPMCITRNTSLRRKVHTSNSIPFWEFCLICCDFYPQNSEESPIRLLEWSNSSSRVLLSGFSSLIIPNLCQSSLYRDYFFVRSYSNHSAISPENVIHIVWEMSPG